MRKNKILALVLVVGALFLASACASQEAAYKTNEVTNQTGSTVDSVLDAAGSVIMYPIHLVGDLFT